MLSITLREGRKGAMDRALVEELIARFREPPDFGAPVEYYREMVRTVLSRERRARLHAVYDTPITTPSTLIWGMKDEAITPKVASKSAGDAGIEVDWRPLADVGHFVGLEAPDDLAQEIRRALAAGAATGVSSAADAPHRPSRCQCDFARGGVLPMIASAVLIAETPVRSAAVGGGSCPRRPPSPAASVSEAWMRIPVRIASVRCSSSWGRSSSAPMTTVRTPNIRSG